MKNFTRLILILVFLTIIFFSCGRGNEIQKEKKAQNNYEGKKIYCSMAGSGDPWSALTKKTRPLILAIHDGNSITQLSELFNKTEDQVKEILKPLIEHNLIKLKEGIYKPDFFISGIDETEKIVQHANEAGELLATDLMNYKEILEGEFSKLTISKTRSLSELGFFLIGSRLLDMGMIGSLVRDGSLLGPAPARPSPGRPDAQYYLWMVEGEPHQQGKYGQEDTDLSWPHWHLLDFGATYMNGVVNFSRKFFEKTSSEAVRSGEAENPSDLAEKLKVPFISRDDSLKWERVVKKISDKLVTGLNERREIIQNFYNTLKSSKYANNSFNEFFCWYFHLTYTRAIDSLSEKGLFTIPSEGHSAVIYYFEGPEGFLTVY